MFLIINPPTNLLSPGVAPFPLIRMFVEIPKHPAGQPIYKQQRIHRVVISGTICETFSCLSDSKRSKLLSYDAPVLSIYKRHGKDHVGKHKSAQLPCRSLTSGQTHFRVVIHSLNEVNADSPPATTNPSPQRKISEGIFSFVVNSAEIFAP